MATLEQSSKNSTTKVVVPNALAHWGREEWREARGRARTKQRETYRETATKRERERPNINKPSIHDRWAQPNAAGQLRQVSSTPIV